MKTKHATIFFLLLVVSQNLLAQTSQSDSISLDLKIREFITDTSSFSFYDPDDSNRLSSSKTDRIGAFNRHVILTRSAHIEDTIAKFKKNSTIYKYHTYFIPIDEYGQWDFDQLEGGGGSQYFFENNNCIKRPMVIYNWRLDMFPGYLYIELITGHNNCSI